MNRVTDLVLAALVAAVAAAAFMIAGNASAETFSFTWDPVNDSRVGQYVLAWGTSSYANGGLYKKGSVSVPVAETVAGTPDLGAGTWYFAVKACTADMSLCSAWSNEVVVNVMGLTDIPAPGDLRLNGVTFVE